MFKMLIESGIHPGMMDYMIWPWLERLTMWNLVHGDLIKISLDNTPLLVCQIFKS